MLIYINYKIIVVLFLVNEILFKRNNTSKVLVKILKIFKETVALKIKRSSGHIVKETYGEKNGGKELINSKRKIMNVWDYFALYKNQNAVQAFVFSIRKFILKKSYYTPFQAWFCSRFSKNLSLSVSKILRNWLPIRKFGHNRWHGKIWQISTNGRRKKSILWIVPRKNFQF